MSGIIHFDTVIQDQVLVGRTATDLDVGHGLVDARYARDPLCRLENIGFHEPW